MKKQLSKILTIYNIGESIIKITTLPSFANEVKKITLADHKEYVLKYYKVLKASELGELNYITNKLRLSGVHIPRVVENRFGEEITVFENKVFELSEYIAHKELKDIKYNIAFERIAQAGRELSMIHSFPINNINIKQFDYNRINNDVMELISQFDLRGRQLCTQDNKLTIKIQVIREFIEIINRDFSSNNLIFSTYGN